MNMNIIRFENIFRIRIRISLFSLNYSNTELFAHLCYSTLFKGNTCNTLKLSLFKGCARQSSMGARLQWAVAFWCYCFEGALSSAFYNHLNLRCIS